MPIIKVKNLSVLIGPIPNKALALADHGCSKTEIKKKTNTILGVHNVNISIPRGKILVLMGLSGSGKSTLLRSIPQLIKPSRGQIFLNFNNTEYDLTNLSSSKLRFVRTHLISMVFQQFSLLPWRTVAENIGFGLEISGYSKKERRVIIEEQLELIGLAPYKETLITQLSGGMQQRVGLARALATHAPILLMDEPFSSLDPLTRNHLQAELKNLQKTLDKTILFVSHDLEEAIRIGDQIAIMREGEIIQCDTPQNILLNPVDSYVKNFTTHINPLSILTAKDIMRKNQSDEALRFSAVVQKNTPAHDLIPLLQDPKTQIGVVNNGVVVGIISSSDFLKSLGKTFQK